MLVLTPHTTSPDALTLLSYDIDAHQVIVKQLSSNGSVPAEVERITLAQFLRDIGIPFPAVREITRQPDPLVA